jgi:hypothetical protein
LDAENEEEREKNARIGFENAGWRGRHEDSNIAAKDDVWPSDNVVHVVQRAQTKPRSFA